MKTRGVRGLFLITGILFLTALAIVLFHRGKPFITGSEYVISISDRATRSDAPACIAEVNGTLITRADFDIEMKNVEGRLFKMGKPLDQSQMPEIKKMVLETLVNRELLLQASRKEGVTVEEDAVEREMQNVKHRFPSNVEFHSLLDKIHITENGLREQYRREMTIQKFVETRCAGDIMVSQKECGDYYDHHLDEFMQPEQVSASHLLIKVFGDVPEQRDEARKKIEVLQRKIKNGEKFSDLARDFSDCPSGVKGGELGSFQRGVMAQPFDDTVFSLRPGQVSGIIETAHGFHLIHVMERKPERKVPLAEAKKAIEQYLKQDKVNQAVSGYLNSLREKSTIRMSFKELETPDPPVRDTKKGRIDIL